VVVGGQAWFEWFDVECSDGLMNTVLNRRDMTRGVHRVVHCTCVPNRIARCYARQLISKSDGIELLGCRS